MAVATAATLTTLTLAIPADAYAAAGSPIKAQPSAVVVKGKTATTNVTVSTRGTVAGWHSVIVLQPMGERQIQVGQGASKAGTFTVTARLTTKHLYPALENELVIEDRATGAWATSTLTVRRQSRVRFEAQSMTYGDAMVPGRVRVTALVRHWTPAGWKASNRSPVRWQVRTAAGWKTVGTDRTNVYGLTGATLKIQPGLRQLRAVRLEGETVTRAVSAAQWVVVP